MLSLPRIVTKLKDNANRLFGGKSDRGAARRACVVLGVSMIGFGRASRVRNGLLRRATAIIAATALFYMPLLAYAPAAQATDYTGTNGQDGGYAPNYGQGGSGGTGGANGNGGSAASGGGGGGYSGGYPGGGGGGADGGGGGGTYYGIDTGTGGGGGAGGAGYILSDGSTFTSSGNVTGGTGGGGGSGLADYSTPNQAGGGGGGGGGGSGIVVQGSGTITNTNTITAGDGGYAGGTAAYNPNLNGHPGAGGYGIRADSSTGVTIYNSGTITGGDAGESTSQGIINIGNAGIYGQNITLYNTGGTIIGGISNGGATNAAAIEITNGMNALHLSGGTIATQIYGDGIKLDSGTSSVELNGGLISTTQNANGIDIVNGMNTITLSSGQISLGQAGTGLLIGGGNNTFTMTGGSIYSVDSGQNIQNYGNAIIVNGGTTTFNISAGSLNGGADGNGGTHVVQFHGGTNTLNVSGTASLSGNYVGDVITANGGINTVSISGGTVKPGSDSPYAINFSGGTNIINVTGGTVGKIYLGGGTNTLEGSGFSDIVTLGSGATAKIIAAGSDVSGITTFDNSGGLTIDSGRSLTVSTFTNESSGTLTLNSGAQLIASTLNLLDGSTIAGAGTLSNGANPLTLSGGSISATVGGTGGLVKSGTGTLTLTGANTYTGGTTVDGGTLSIADGALGGGDVTLAEGTTIKFNGSSFTTTNDFHITGDPVFDVASGTTQTVSGVIDDATGPTNPGVVEKTGAGTLLLSGANTYSGGTTIAAGILQIGTDSVFNTPGDPASGIVSSAIGTGTLTFGGGTLQAGSDTIIANGIDLNTADGTIDANGHDISLAGLISGTHGLSIVSSGGGAVTFANASNSINGIAVGGSGLRISESGDGDFGSGLVALGDGTGITFTAAGNYSNTVTVSGDPTFDTGGNIVTYSGLIADGGIAGDVEVTGGGTLILTNTGNSYTGGTVVFDGSMLSIDSDSELGGAAGGVMLGDATTTGTLAVTQNITSARTITLNAGGGIISAPFGKTLTLSGQVTGSGGLTVSGPGGVFLRGNANNYSGGTTIASGYVMAGRPNVLGTGPLAIKAAGLLDLNSNSQSVGSLTDGGDVHGGTIANSGVGAAILTLGSGNSNSAFSGVIQNGSGAIILFKAGTGTLALSGANTYSGGTEVDAGVLQAGIDTVGSHGAITSSAIGTGALTLDDGTLQLGGSYTIANDIGLGTHSGTIDANGYYVTLSGNITGSTGIVFTDTAATRSFTNLSGNNTYSGTTTIASGVVDLSSATALSAISDYVVSDTGAAGGAGRLDMNGFSGTMLSLAGNTGGQVYNDGPDATLTIAPASGSATFAGTIKDSGAGQALALVMNGAAGSKEILSGANTYVGGTTISGGILGVGSNTALGTGTVTLDGGTLETEGDFTLANALAVNSTGGTIDANGQALFLAGGIGNGINGNAGTLTFTDTSGNGIVVLQGTSSYGGAVVIDSGATVAADGANTLPGGAYTVNGTLNITGAQTISSLAGSGSAVGNFGGGTLSVNQASGTSTFSGTLDDNGSNPLSLVKAGAGTLNLSGANTFTGGTTLNAGTLGALDSSALGSGGVTLNGGALVYGNTVNIANAITLAGDAALEVDGTDSATQSGAIGDNGSAHTLQKLGSGTLQLTQANSYSGTTKLTAGTLEIGNAGALGSSALLFDGGTLKADGAYTIANNISLDANGGTFDTNGYATDLTGTLSSGGTDGALTIAGTGSFKVSGLNNLSGGAVLDANAQMEVAGASGMGVGDVSMNAGSAIHFTTTSGTFTNRFLLDGAASFDVDSGLTTTLNNVIADAPSAGSPSVLEKTGAGTLALSGANTYSGGTILTDGILRLDAGTDSNGVSPLGTGTVTFNGGTLQAGGDYTYANSLNETGGGTIDANGHQFSLTGSITGSTNLTFADSQGGGAVTVTGHNFFNGNVTIDHAIVILTGNNSGTGIGPLGVGTTTLDGGTLLSEQSGFIDNQIALGADGGTLRATDPNGFGFGPISDAVAGAGPLTIGAPGDTGVVSLSDGSTYTGGTIIAAGTLRALGGTSVLGDASGTVEMKSGTTLDLENATVVANTLILDDTTPTLEVSGGTSTINGGVQELSGTPGGFTKTGTGTLMLAGANNYSGGTSIAAGTLELGSVLSVVSAGTYDVASGASLDIGGSLGSVYIGALSGAGSLTAFSGTNLNVGGVGLNSDDTTFSGAINADYLAYDGLGTLTLSGTGSDIKQLIVCGCTSSGGITLSGGSLTAAVGVGVSGQTFTVTDGVQLTTPDFEQGGGTVVISGAGTTVDATNSGSGLIAVYTTASRAPVFTISDGAQVTGDTLMSGLSGGTVAPQITVTGAASLLSLTNSVQLNDGTSLTVADGATLTTPSIDLDTNASLMIGTGALAGTVGDASTRIQGLSSGTSVVANFTGDSTLGGFLTGALGLSVQNGNLTLTNASNDYSGGTTIGSGAVLTLKDSSAGTGAVSDAGFLAIQNSAASTFAYNLSGPGGLAQIGDGALTINTAQVYAGSTVIAPNATLFLTGAGDLSRSSGVEADGTFDISGVTASSVGINKLFGNGDVEIGSKTLVVAGNGGVFSGILSDGGNHGGLTVLGDQVLNGVVSLTGTTTIGTGATLTVSGPDALGGSALNFQAGSILKFGGSGTYTNAMTFATGAPVFDVTNQSVILSGVLGGPGDLAVTGANGTLTLTNTGNTYAGGTEVYGNATLNVGADSELGAVAALQLGDASTKGTLQYGASFALDSGRTMTLNAGGGAINTNGFDATIASTIGGAGGLAKLGTGTLTLTGTNTYTGATTVNAGTLQVNGLIASSAVTIASGGTLSGSGTVGSTSVLSGGTIVPNGNTLHVSGALTLANGATTAIAVTPTTSGQIAATGSASLDGVLAITQGAGTYASGSSFQFISASSVTGTFDSVTGASFTGLDSSIVYSATGVELDLTTPANSGGSGSGGGSGGGGGPGGGSVVTKFLFGTYGKTANQIAAGKALAAGDPNGALYVAMGNVVKVDVSGVPAALGRLSGDIHASMRSAMIEDGRMVRDTILDHVRFSEQGTSVWGAGFYNNGGIDSDGNAAALHHNSTGFLAGVDMPFGDGFRAGIGAGAVSNNASEPGRASTASGSTGHVLAYAGWSDSALTLKLGGDYGWGDVDVTREVAALLETNRASERQRTMQFFGEAAYLFSTDVARIEPYGDFAHVSARTGAFVEKSGTSALSGGGNDDDLTYVTVGVRGTLSSMNLGGTSIVPKLGIGWQHALDRFKPDEVLTLQNASQDFTVQGVPLSRDTAVVQAGLGLVLAPDIVLDIAYDGAFSSSSRDHGVRGALRWSF